MKNPGGINAIYLQFSSLFGPCGVSNCKNKRQLEKELSFKVEDFFIDLLNFEWHSQNEVGNIAIFVLWGDCEKLLLYTQTSTQMFKTLRKYHTTQKVY